MKAIWIPEKLWTVYFPESEIRSGAYKHEYALRLAEIYNNEHGCSSETPDDFRQMARFNREEAMEVENDVCYWMAEVLDRAADLVEELV